MRSFKSLLERAGLPAGTRLYDLRHTYSHVLKGMDGGIGCAMDASLG